MVLSANIEQSGTELSGNWFESEYRQGGKVYGTNKDGLIEARIEGNTVAALVTIQTKSNRQSFLMEAPGSWMSEVAIELNKDSKCRRSSCRSSLSYTAIALRLGANLAGCVAPASGCIVSAPARADPDRIAL
jgi:hypothetical protein